MYTILYTEEVLDIISLPYLSIVASIDSLSMQARSLECYSGNYTKRRRAAAGRGFGMGPQTWRECPRRPATILFSTMGGGGGVEWSGVVRG